jgi:hypothetical protein
VAAHAQDEHQDQLRAELLAEGATLLARAQGIDHRADRRVKMALDVVEQLLPGVPRQGVCLGRRPEFFGE